MPRSASIEDGRVAIDWGVYGVPETFIVDGAGMIRFKWIGPLTAAAVDGTFSAEIEKAKTPLPEQQFRRGGVS